jgi:putative tricarboxylic transport membrane protein
MIRIKSINDVLFGGLLICVGTAAILLLRPLRAGTALDMGPGYMPMALGLIAIALGLLIAARGLLAEGPAPERWPLRPLAAILTAIGVFLLVQRVGLVAAVAAVTMIAALADARIRWREAMALAAFLSLFTALVFVVGLRLPFRLWPRQIF